MGLAPTSGKTEGFNYAANKKRNPEEMNPKYVSVFTELCISSSMSVMFLVTAVYVICIIYVILWTHC